MRTFNEIENLLDSGWGFDEILTEVEIRRRYERPDALRWLRDQCLNHPEGAKLAKWCKDALETPPGKANR